MAGDDEQPVTGAEGGDDVREHEDEARRARSRAEGERADTERDVESTPPVTEADEDSVVPADTDAERRGVMPPPEGTGSG